MSGVEDYSPYQAGVGRFASMMQIPLGGRWTAAEKAPVAVVMYPDRPMKAPKGQTPTRKISTWVMASRDLDVNIPYRPKSK
jgi:hypothetical protein